MDYDQNIEDIKASLQRIEEALAYLTGKPADKEYELPIYEPTIAGAIEASKKGKLTEYLMGNNN
jgi:hypothetical protein